MLQKSAQDIALAGRRASSSAVKRSPVLIPAMGGVLVAVMLASLAIGPTGISLDAIPEVLGALWSGAEDPAALRSRLVLLDLRAPRTLIGAYVGAALAVAGAMMQGTFRNPLADPGLVGVSSGAALAAVATIALSDDILSGWSSLLGMYTLPVSAFLGGMLTTALLVAIAGRGSHASTATLLLSGIAIGALASAGTGLVAYASDDRELRDMTLWSMGSLTGASWVKVTAVVPFAIVLAIAVPGIVRALNGLLLGESEAFNLGIDVVRAKLVIITLTAVAVGSAVAVSGVIGFVGIVVPHFVRLIGGPDHRFVLPASALVGAVVLLIADILARTSVAPAELPIGILMALIGAPVFLHLVLKRGWSG